MTAKEFVKTKYPDAHATRREVYTLEDENTRWTIWVGNAQLASGKTESNAWVNAKRILEED